MKLLTLNAHSIIGERAAERADLLRDFIVREAPDFVALQEASQSMSAEAVDGGRLVKKYKAPSGMRQIPIKEDNFALNLVESVNKQGIDYYFSWLPVKCGYGKLDEGLAFLSRRPIETAQGFFVSREQNYNNWRCRMALKIRVLGHSAAFYDLHMSRWDDAAEPFERQWRTLSEHLREDELVWLMGDLNNPAEVRGEGYDTVVNQGFYDSFFLSDERRGGGTAIGNIDGWKDGDGSASSRRIDFIFSNFRPIKRALRYRTVLDGSDGERVSDHFGVMLEIL